MITLKDIASIAKVNISTVSRALSNSPRVNEETRQQILSIAKRLDYQTNDLARGLAGKRTNTFGIILPNLMNTFYPDIIDAIEMGAAENGYTIILGKSDGNEEKMFRYIDVFSKKKVSGIFIAAHKQSSRLANQINGIDIPLVMIDVNAADEKIAFESVRVDNEYGARLAVEHLASLMHRDIAFIGGASTVPSRFNGYRKTILELGLQYDEALVAIDDPVSEKGGYVKMYSMIKYKKIPSAVFCANDRMAVGALKALSDLGLDVPKDISVVGFDDIEIVSYLPRPLTTVSQPKGEIGRIAARRMFEILKNDAFNPQDVKDTILKPELVIRETTAQCKGR